jgi:hypothetical protein
MALKRFSGRAITIYELLRLRSDQQPIGWKVNRELKQRDFCPIQELTWH